MSVSYKNISRRLHICMYVVLQYLTYFFSYPYIFFWRIRVLRPKNFNIPKGAVLFISNHQSWADPFLIVVAIGFQNFFSHLNPTRFPVMSEFMRRPLMGKMIAALGGYDIGDEPVERMKKLLYTREILVRHKQRLLIFPEGRINRVPDLVHHEFQDGIKMLFRDDIPIIFIRLTGLNDLSFKNFFNKERRSIKYSDILDNITPEEKMEKMKSFFS